MLLKDEDRLRNFFRNFLFRDFFVVIQIWTYMNSLVCWGIVLEY